jgi:hypothetical protein
MAKTTALAKTVESDELNLRGRRWRFGHAPMLSRPGAKSVGRWIALGPAAALTAFVIPALVKHLIPFALILGPDPNSAFGRVLIETMAGAAAGWAFVEVGARIAPRHRRKVARVLAVTTLAVVAVATLGDLIASDYLLMWQALCAAFAAFGAASAIGRGETIPVEAYSETSTRTEARSPPTNSKQTGTLTPAEKLAKATADYEKWSAVAATPGMSPRAGARTGSEREGVNDSAPKGGVLSSAESVTDR